MHVIALSHFQIELVVVTLGVFSSGNAFWDGVNDNRRILVALYVDRFSTLLSYEVTNRSWSWIYGLSEASLLKTIAINHLNFNLTGLQELAESWRGLRMEQATQLLELNSVNWPSDVDPIQMWRKTSQLYPRTSLRFRYLVSNRWKATTEVRIVEGFGPVSIRQKKGNDLWSFLGDNFSMIVKTYYEYLSTLNKRFAGSLHFHYIWGTRREALAAPVAQPHVIENAPKDVQIILTQHSPNTHPHKHRSMISQNASTMPSQKLATRFDV